MAKILLTLIILYLIMKAAASLLRATRYGIPGSNQSPPRERPGDAWEVKRTVSGQTYQQEWTVSHSQRNGRREPKVDDARWRDV